MKTIITFFFLTSSIIACAQPKIVTQAMITTKTTIIAPDGDEQPQTITTTSAEGGETRTIRISSGDGETK